MKQTFVYLFIGNIQKYKGVERLVDAYLSSKIKNSLLVIAGSCTDDIVDNAIRIKSRSNSILYINQRIPDAEIQYYLNSADVVVYPFEKITTSGSVMLALSFGKPIIYPLMGALIDLPANIGFSYSSMSSTGLSESLTKVYRQRSRLLQIASAARKYAESQNWALISNRTYLEYMSLIK